MDEPFDWLLEPVTNRFHQPWPATIASVLRFRRHAAAAADCLHPDHLNANSIVPSVFDRDRHIVGGRGPQSHGLTNHLHVNKGPSGKTEPACRKDEGRDEHSNDRPGPDFGDRRTDPAGAGRTADLR